MIREKAMELVAALRSGEYKQGTHYLQRLEGAACCLGVACLLSGVTKVEPPLGRVGFLFDSGDDGLLPSSVQNLFGFYSSCGARRDRLDLVFPGFDEVDGTAHMFSSLAAANDRGIPFSAIADYIEANWEAL